MADINFSAAVNGKPVAFTDEADALADGPKAGSKADPSPSAGDREEKKSSSVSSAKAKTNANAAAEAPSKANGAVAMTDGDVVMTSGHAAMANGGPAKRNGDAAKRSDVCGDSKSGAGAVPNGDVPNGDGAKPAALASVCAGDAAMAAALAAPGRTGKRSRRAPTKFVAEEPASPKKPRREGSGVALGSVPNISYMLSCVRAKDDEVVALHKLCCGLPGNPAKRKEGIRNFKGFSFRGEGDRAKMRVRVGKENVGVLRKMGKVLDVDVGGGREKKEVVEELIKFLELPRIVEGRVDLKVDAEKKKVEKEEKKVKEKEGKGKAKAKTKNMAEGAKSKANGAVHSDSDSEDSEAEVVLSRAASQGKVSKPKVKRVKRKSKTNGKISKAGKKGTAKPSIDSEGEESSEEEPEAVDPEEPPLKNSKKDDDAVPEDGGPSNKQLREKVKLILGERRANALTARELRTRLEIIYECKLESRMSFLREEMSAIVKEKERAEKVAARKKAAADRASAAVELGVKSGVEKDASKVSQAKESKK